MNCKICDLADVLEQCPQCERNVCKLCRKSDVCDICILVQMKYEMKYTQHKSQVKEQETQLKDIHDKMIIVDEEINIAQKAGQFLSKQTKSSSNGISETILDKQHELEDIEDELQTQQSVLDQVNEELNQLKSQNLKLQTQNKELDLKIQDSEKEQEDMEDQLNLQKQYIMQVIKTLKNKTSLVRGSYDVEKHYSQSQLKLQPSTSKQQKTISNEDKVQGEGLCAGQCQIQ